MFTGYELPRIICTCLSREWLWISLNEKHLFADPEFEFYHNSRIATFFLLGGFGFRLQF